MFNKKQGSYLFFLFVFLISASQVSAQSVSNDVTVTAAVDNALPTVNITNPSNGDTISGITTVTANASDDGGITKVEFYIDGFLRLTDVSAPYTFSWDTTGDAKGSHAILAIAYDIVNNTATDSINVIVSNPAPSLPPSTPPTQVPKQETEGSLPNTLRKVLVDLPDVFLIGPEAAVAGGFIFGFIIASEIALIFLLIFLIFKDRKKKKVVEATSPNY